jgi:acyl-CoA synthetase (AMP-forming)/AMP-acid ligase II
MGGAAMRSTMPTFHERLAQHARDRASWPACVAPGRTMTYGELLHATEALAEEFRARGIEDGAAVALTVRGEIDHLVASLALLLLGVAQLGLASHDPPVMRERFARRVGTTHVVGDLPGDAVAGLPWIDLAGAMAASRDRPAARPLREVDPHAPAIFITGSGTTGEPKILRFSQHEIALQSTNYGRQHGERALRAAHVEHNAGKRNRLYALWEGRTCILAEGDGALREVGLRLRASAIEAPPLHIAGLVVACRRDGAIPGVAVRSGGTMVPWALRRDVLEFVTPRLFVAYGTTEAGIVSVAGPGLHDERELVGRLADGVEVRVLEKDGSPVQPGEIGEIAIRAPGMAKRYFDDPEATSRHFRDGWFLPGDMASRTQDGLLCIHGRVDDMMILNSVNVFPAEIERVLEAHPAVGAAAAFPIASPAHGQIPAAAVELRASHGCDPAELLAYVRERLGIRAPRRVEILAELPRNPSGKVNRREIARLFDTKKGD